MVEHYSDRHIDYLRQALRQDKAPVGLFLSAGCGVSVKSEGEPLVPDIAGMTAQVRSMLEGKNEMKEPLETLIGTFAEANPNVEELLSRTRALAAVADIGPVHGLTIKQLASIHRFHPAG